MKLLYKLLRADMIRRMKAKGWKEQRINTVLAAFDLPIKSKGKKIKYQDIEVQAVDFEGKPDFKFLKEVH